MAWWQISVQCTDDELEQTEDVLLSLGAVCITMRDAQDSPIYEPTPGESPVWPHIIMTGMFQQDREGEELYEELLELLPDHQSATARKSVLEDQDWERVHLQQFKPIRCAHNLWIVHQPAQTQNLFLISCIFDQGKTLIKYCLGNDHSDQQ